MIGNLDEHAGAESRFPTRACASLGDSTNSKVHSPPLAIIDDLRSFALPDANRKHGDPARQREDEKNRQAPALSPRSRGRAAPGQRRA